MQFQFLKPITDTNPVFKYNFYAKQARPEQFTENCNDFKISLFVSFSVEIFFNKFYVRAIWKISVFSAFQLMCDLGIGTLNGHFPASQNGFRLI